MLKFLLGLFLGANISLFLYACLIIGKRADEIINDWEVKRE